MQKNPDVCVITRVSFFQGEYSSHNRLLKYFANNVRVIEPRSLRRISKKIFQKTQIYGKFGERVAYRLYEVDLKERLLLFMSKNKKIVHFLYGDNARLFTAKRSFYKTVVTCHQPGSFVLGIIDGTHRRRRRRYLKFLNSLKMSDAVVLTGSNDLNFYSEYVDPAKLSVILHGVDTNFFRPSSNKLSYPRVLTVGNWLRDFNLWKKVVHNLGSKYPEVIFTVVTTAARKEYIRKEILPQLQGLEERIELLCNISDKELLSIYNSTSILFLPLHDALANNALLEGMSCGLPVVISDVGAVYEYTSGSQGVILCDNTNIEDFTSSIFELLNNNEKHQKCSLAARQRAEELDWSIIADQYMNLYKKIWHKS